MVSKLIQLKEELTAYSYDSLLNVASEGELDKYIALLENRADSLAESWTKQLNTEWCARFYLAIKLFSASGLLLDSERYCREHSVFVVEPYLLYYGTFSAVRAALMTVIGCQ
jgi:hypothetical protein